MQVAAWHIESYILASCPGPKMSPSATPSSPVAPISICYITPAFHHMCLQIWMNISILVSSQPSENAKNQLQCSSVPFFELGSVNHDYYLVNTRIGVRFKRNTSHDAGVYMKRASATVSFEHYIIIDAILLSIVCIVCPGQLEMSWLMMGIWHSKMFTNACLLPPLQFWTFMAFALGYRQCWPTWFANEFTTYII